MCCCWPQVKSGDVRFCAPVGTLKPIVNERPTCSPVISLSLQSWVSTIKHSKSTDRAYTWRFCNIIQKFNTIPGRKPFVDQRHPSDSTTTSSWITNCCEGTRRLYRTNGLLSRIKNRSRGIWCGPRVVPVLWEGIFRKCPKNYFRH